jgi:hypothetical protein
MTADGIRGPVSQYPRLRLRGTRARLIEIKAEQHRQYLWHWQGGPEYHWEKLGRQRWNYLSIASTKAIVL